MWTWNWFLIKFGGYNWRLSSSFSESKKMSCFSKELLLPQLRSSRRVRGLAAPCVDSDGRACSSLLLLGSGRSDPPSRHVGSRCPVSSLLISYFSPTLVPQTRRSRSASGPTTRCSTSKPQFLYQGCMLLSSVPLSICGLVVWSLTRYCTPWRRHAL